MRVTIYGAGACPYCQRAKMVCQAKGIQYEYKEIGVDITKERLTEQIGPFSTVPQIFVTSDGFSEYVGGFEDFYKRMTK